MYAASSEARNRRAQPTSSGSARRPSGIDATIRSRNAGSRLSRPGVRTFPGRIALTVIPSPTSSSAAVRIAQALSRRLGAGTVHVRDDDARALRGEDVGDTAPDAVRRAGHDRDASVEALHAVSEREEVRRPSIARMLSDR